MIGTRRRTGSVDTTFLGQPRKVLAWPNRNGFFYVIDRTNGKFLSAKAFVKQTWNDGFDFEKNGRPIRQARHGADAGRQRPVWPGIDGGSNWMAHSYSPLTKLLYVFAREERRLFTKNEVPHPTTEPDGPGPSPQQLFNRGRGPRFAPEESWARRLPRSSNGNIKWEHRVVTPPWGGLMSTAGNLVFGGTMEGSSSRWTAYDWRAVWTFTSNGPVYGSAISYLADGKQYVSIPAGDLLVTLGLD
jgi:alcohol dehydrogenase (cytochrome c)